MVNSTTQTHTLPLKEHQDCTMRTSRHQCLRKRTEMHFQRSLCHCTVILLAILNLTLCVQAQSSNDCSTQHPQTQAQCLQGETFFNETSQCCQTCSVCPTGTYQQGECNVTHDTNCVSRCTHRCLYWEENEGRCILDCSCCASKECDRDSGNKKCLCDRNCFLDSDLFCDRNVCGTEEPSVITERPEVRSNSQNTLPPWGIGLVAIGVVIGIVAFSACFLLMGFVTTTRRGDIEIQGSENSESGLVPPGSQMRAHSSLGTNSTYMSSSNASVFLTNQKILELLRDSNSHSSLNSSPRSSPRSTGSLNASPKPVRTVHVTLKGRNTMTSI